MTAATDLQVQDTQPTAEPSIADVCAAGFEPRSLVDMAKAETFELLGEHGNAGELVARHL